MVELHTIAALLSFNETDMPKDVVSSFIASQIAGFLKTRPKFEQQINEQLQRWGRSLSSEVQHKPAPPELEAEFLLHQEALPLPAELFRSHESRLICQLATHSPFHDEAIGLLKNSQGESIPDVQAWRPSTRAARQTVDQVQVMMHTFPTRMSHCRPAAPEQRSRNCLHEA